MSIIYNVTIEPTEKGKRFHIAWHNPESNTVDSFKQSADLTSDETQMLCHQQRYQLTNGTIL